MKWEVLVEYKNTSLKRGSLIKFLASFPFENEVVMMICEGPDNASQRCLRTITGSKSGIGCYQAFPKEASSEGCFISTEWLINNWQKWVWPEGDVCKVWVRDPLQSSDLD